MSRVLPILFNTEMVKAILDGRKTVTRRLVKPQPDNKHQNPLGYCVSSTGSNKDIGKYGFGINEYGGHIQYAKPPYQVGNILYVRETWKCDIARRYDANVDIEYRAGGESKRIIFPNGGTDSIDRYAYDKFVEKWYGAKWHPSLHMPKEAARIFLKVTDVRVERLQDITEEQAIKEGASSITTSNIPWKGRTYIQGFGELWNSTVKEDWQKFESNPWVWVIYFERREKPSELN